MIIPALKTPVILSAILVASIGLCDAGELKAAYKKSAVQPVTVQRLQNDEISIRYHVFPESSFCSVGADYEKTGDTLKIVIVRAAIGGKTTASARNDLPLDDKWQGEVHIPYHGEKVVLVSTDSEDQIYP